MVKNVTYVRHGLAAAFAGAVASLAGWLGLAIDPEAIAALEQFATGFIAALTIAVYAFAEKFLKRWTKEEEE